MPEPLDLRDQLQAALGTAYRLERELGGGGMSRVFVADETALGRKVVIKVLAPELAAGVSAERFTREIRLAAKLQHPNIVPLHAAGVAGGLPYYTMPFVEGSSLRSRIKNGPPLSLREDMRILHDVARAICYAHEQGIVHRDIKPENILLSGDAAVVTDFGIAKAVSAAKTIGSGETLTSVGMGIGTPAYMAPEQASGDPSTDYRADIYSFGCVAYELVTGKPPFTDRPVHQLMIAHAMETPQPVDVKNPEVPEPLAALVMQCLAKNPADRPQSAREVVERIDRLATSSGTTGFRVRAAANKQRVVIGGLAAGLVLVAIGIALYSRGGMTGRDVAGELQSVAVLPFENVGGDTANAYFAVGMADELANALAKVPAIRVAARSSAFTFQGRRVDAREVGRALNVGAVLEGTVRRSGNRMRVTAQLVSANDGLVRWGDSYERDAQDVFSVQDDITRSIVRALRVKLDPTARAGKLDHGTADLAAYDLYLRGRYAWNKRTPEGLQEAIKYFEDAIKRDSTYALAYSGMADAYISLFDYDILPAAQANPKSRAAAMRAIELDSTLAEAHRSLAHVLLHEWKWDESEAEFKHALDLDPVQADTYHWYALALTAVGKLDEAVAAMKRAEQLDPLSARVSADLGMAYYGARQYDRAIEQERKTLRLEPEFATSYWIMGMSNEQKGALADATAAYERALKLRPGSPNYLASLARSYALAGKTSEARRVLNGLLHSPQPVSPFFIALVYTATGQKDSAFRWLDSSIVERSGSVRYLKIEPRLDPLRSDPRFNELLLRVGLKTK